MVCYLKMALSGCIVIQMPLKKDGLDRSVVVQISLRLCDLEKFYYGMYFSNNGIYLIMVGVLKLLHQEGKYLHDLRLSQRAIVTNLSTMLAPGQHPATSVAELSHCLFVCAVGWVMILANGFK